ncbi:MAG: DUF4367 domain-containing protein [Clostridium sp.]|jgi:hypothetical protein|nr:DUF4367 domain-containing protein [Clostridium sp.]
MKEQIFRDPLTESIFRQAVIDNFEREIAETGRLPDIKVSERQKTRMAKLFAKVGHRKRTAVVRLWVKRSAAVAASLSIVLSGALLTVPGVRAEVGGAIAGWFSAFTQFGSENGGGDSVSSPDWHPAVLPEGFYEVSRSQVNAILSIRYANATGDTVEFKCVPNTDSLSVNNENVEYAQILHSGTVYYTFAAVLPEYTSAVVWDYDGYIFMVSGYLSTDQLLEMAWSVKK